VATNALPAVHAGRKGVAGDHALLPEDKKRRLEAHAEAYTWRRQDTGSARSLTF